MEQTHVHFEDGVIYCDVQTFKQEAYILKVLGGGSPMTIFWAFEVLQKKGLMPDNSLAEVRLGRQVIPDLVTKRWLMRDLSAGVVRYTTDIYMAMRFLTEMVHVAIMDESLLETGQEYSLDATLYVYEGEWKEEGWWSSLTNWGEDMGSVSFVLPTREASVE